MSSTELVGPLPTIRFYGGPRPIGGLFASNKRRNLPAVAYVPPRNTLDPRYDGCTDHHVACDCREAEFAEERAEQRVERKQTQGAFDEVLAGHETWNYDGKSPGCMCTGCQIARACHIWPTTAYGEPS